MAHSEGRGNAEQGQVRAHRPGFKGVVVEGSWRMQECDNVVPVNGRRVVGRLEGPCKGRVMGEAVQPVPVLAEAEEVNAALHLPIPNPVHELSG